MKITECRKCGKAVVNQRNGLIEFCRKCQYVIGPRRRNQAEQAFVAFAVSQGYTITKKGWPDFFCIKNGKYICVEVKPSKRKQLKKPQLEIADILRENGIECVRWDPEHGFAYPDGDPYPGFMERLAREE